MLRCPFSWCGKTFDSFRALKNHVIAVHRGERECPICRKEYKNLRRHLSKKALFCDEHAKVYVLMRNRRKSTAGNEHYKILVSKYYGDSVV